jgi:hypothetical protein
MALTGMAFKNNSLAAYLYNIPQTIIFLNFLMEFATSLHVCARARILGLIYEVRNVPDK